LTALVLTIDLLPNALDDLDLDLSEMIDYMPELSITL